MRARLINSPYTTITSDEIVEIIEIKGVKQGVLYNAVPADKEHKDWAWYDAVGGLGFWSYQLKFIPILRFKLKE